MIYQYYSTSVSNCQYPQKNFPKKFLGKSTNKIINSGQLFCIVTYPTACCPNKLQNERLKAQTSPHLSSQLPIKK